MKVTEVEKIPQHLRRTADAEKLYSSLPDEHIIKVLMDEHQTIRKFLTILNDLLEKIETMKSVEEDKETIFHLEEIVRYLMSTEKHHIREENVVISRLDDTSAKLINASIKIRKEHDDLGIVKRRLYNLMLRVYTMYFNTFKKEYIHIARQLGEALMKHIQYEESVLYPATLQQIKDSDEWQVMHKESERIGDSCLTPGFLEKSA